jgi:hypothetical protein
MNLKVVAERKAGFTGPITVRMLFSPPGTSSGSTATIAANANETTLPVSASGGAAIRSWKVAVLGSADQKGNVWVSSQLVNLKIAEPYIAAKFAMASIEQGKGGTVVCTLEHKQKFEGKAKVELRGLPAGVTATPATKEISASDEKVSFEVTTSPKSPPGQHKNLLAQVTIIKDGEPIIHNVGQGGILRVDRTPEAKGADKKPAAKGPVAAKEGGK